MVLYIGAAWDVRRWDIYGCCFSLTKEADGNIRPENDWRHLVLNLLFME